MGFNCPSCPRSRESLSMLHMHCMVAHPKQIFTCPWCTVPFGSLQALQKHGGNCRKLEQREVKAPREGEIDEFFIHFNECQVCDCKFTSNDEAIKHYKVEHLNFTYICDMCQMNFSQSGDLDIHYVVCGADPTSPSTASKTATAFNGSSSSQIKGIQNISACHVDCDAASEDCAAAAMLNDSELIEFYDEYCMECEMEFENSREFAEHFDAEHDVFVCTVCKVGFIEPALLRKHFAQKHAGDKYSTYYYGNELRKSFANQTEMSSTDYEHLSQVSCPFLVDCTVNH